jgi:hypothetical protein
MSSGTTTFALSNASIALAAYSRIQIRRTAMLAEHMADAYNEFNLMQVKFNNLAPPNLWKVDLVTLPLIAGQTTYAVDASTIQILDAYLTYDSSPQSDRLIFPISRTEYASYPNKTSQGVPSVFWFDRLISPTITLWLVPDATATYTLKYYRCSQIQDANFPSGETPDVVFNRWLDAMVSELSYRLARIWKPELEQVRKADAQEAWSVAATNDTENVSLALLPQLSGYYN